MANILKTEKKVAVISMLCEGTSICSISRISNLELVAMNSGQYVVPLDN